MIATLRRELLDRVLIVDERHLPRILTIYLHHVTTARPHCTLGQLAVAQAKTQSPSAINLTDHQVRPRPILGALTSEYQIAASSIKHHQTAGQAQNPVFEPHRTGCGSSITAIPNTP